MAFKLCGGATGGSAAGDSATGGSATGGTCPPAAPPNQTQDSVEGTVFDFRRPRELGRSIDELPATKGYDHCFVIRGEVGRLRPAARVVEPESGRLMAVATTLPGMQLYTANHLDGSESTGGLTSHQAFCMETQMFPDSPNQPSFPSTLVRPGETWRATTVYHFGVGESTDASP